MHRRNRPSTDGCPGSHPIESSKEILRQPGKVCASLCAKKEKPGAKAWKYNTISPM